MFWFSPSLLLVLTCLQSFTSAFSGNGPEECCFGYNKYPIAPVHVSAYGMTRSDCTYPGIIFATKDGKRVCVDPSDKWVKKAIKKINQRLKRSSQTQPKSHQPSPGPS